MHAWQRYITNCLVTLLRKACLAVCLVLSVRSLRAAYQPLVTRLELPAHAGQVYFASADVLASTAGVLALDTSGNWKRTSVTKPAYAVGGSTHKWWAAGKGFVALSNGQEVSFDDTGFSGVETNSGVFVSGERGIWRIVDGAATFVLPTSKPTRLLTLGDDLWALTGDRAMRWDGTKFMDSPWSGSRRVYYPFPWENGVYYGTTKGFAYYTPDAGETFAFPSISPVEIKKALTGFARDRDRLYSASYLAGLAAYARGNISSRYRYPANAPGLRTSEAITCR